MIRSENIKTKERKTPLNDARKEIQLHFAQDHMARKSGFRYVVSSNEKKFNLQRPNEYNDYFHNLRKEEDQIERLHSGVGGVMVRGAFSVYGTCELKFLNTNMNANTYENIL